ncbi:MAG: calcium/sodium antiporter [Christensenellaceae bacterium]
MEFLQNFMDSIHVVFVVLFCIIGFIAIIKGGDWFVDSSSYLAEATGIPKLIVGATVVSIGTTLPELLVSLFSAIAGKYDMAAGNAIGSVTVNTAVVLSLALIFMPATIKRKDYALKSVLLFLPLVVMFAFSFKGNVNSRLPLYASIILLVIFAANIAENLWGAKKVLSLQTPEEKQQKKPIVKKEMILKIVFFFIGAVLLFVGAQLLQTSSITIAHKIGIPEQIIGLTIVAIGTSLPELVTTVTAIVKKEYSLSAGNIIGANILDLTLILSLCGIVSGGALPMSAQTVLFDIPFCLLVSAIAIVPALITKKFHRIQGFINIALYIAYVVIMIIGVGKIGIFVG